MPSFLPHRALSLGLLVVAPCLAQPTPSPTTTQPDSSATHPDSASRPPRDTASPVSMHFRTGVHFSGDDGGLQAGFSGKGRHLGLGFDAWVRPGAYTREIRLTPTRRTRHQEVLYGFFPWIQWEFGDEIRLAPVAGFEFVNGYWYGTKDSPATEATATLGGKIVLADHFQVALRYAFTASLITPWRGDITWEF